MCAALAPTGLAAYLSEERDDAVVFSDTEERIVVASDPLDGSSNIDTNLTIGTIFSFYKAEGGSWLMQGRAQQAAGFFAYGPQTLLLLTIGQGVAGFCLDADGRFIQMDWQPQIPATTGEFSINAANSRYWTSKTQSYIRNCWPVKRGQGAQFLICAGMALWSQMLIGFFGAAVYFYTPGIAARGMRTGACVWSMKPTPLPC